MASSARVPSAWRRSKPLGRASEGFIHISRHPVGGESWRGNGTGRFLLELRLRQQKIQLVRCAEGGAAGKGQMRLGSDRSFSLLL